jgi:hypothetical protein
MPGFLSSGDKRVMTLSSTCAGSKGAKEASPKTMGVKTCLSFGSAKALLRISAEIPEGSPALMPIRGKVLKVFPQQWLGREAPGNSALHRFPSALA